MEIINISFTHYYNKYSHNNIKILNKTQEFTIAF